MGSWLGVGDTVSGSAADALRGVAGGKSTVMSSIDEVSTLSSDVVSADSSVAAVESVPCRSLEEFLNDLGV